MNKYRVVCKQWFDEFGVGGRIVFRVERYKPTILGWRWITETHSAPPDGYQSPTDFPSHEAALKFIAHVCAGGAVQEWIREVLPREFTS